MRGYVETAAIHTLPRNLARRAAEKWDNSWRRFRREERTESLWGGVSLFLKIHNIRLVCRLRRMV